MQVHATPTSRAARTTRVRADRRLKYSPRPGEVRSSEHPKDEEKSMSRRGKTGREDRQEGALDKAKGRVKEAAGALSGDQAKKSEGRSDQRRGTMKVKRAT